ncbi:hypothetical protein Tco_0002794 [Tanacetum coccineum]
MRVSNLINKYVLESIKNRVVILISEYLVTEISLVSRHTNYHDELACIRDYLCNVLGTLLIYFSTDIPRFKNTLISALGYTICSFVFFAFAAVLDGISPAKEFLYGIGSGCLANVVMSFFLYGVSGQNEVVIRVGCLVAVIYLLDSILIEIRVFQVLARLSLKGSMDGFGRL